MRVALVHDYLKEYGGAERVLQALSELFPEAPIYTAFYVADSPAGEAFAKKQIITSGLNKILQWKNLYSPLRFLTPLIWESFNFKGYDLVISSASWYITKSIITHPPTVHICYCHTPPRWLYGYQTAVEWKRFLPIRIYGQILAHFLRQYDYLAAQRVDYFIANSQNTKERIKKFYRRNAEVIYPPVYLATKKETSPSFLRPAPSASGFSGQRDNMEGKQQIGIMGALEKGNASFLSNSQPPIPNYYLVVSRLESPKNIDLAIKACNKLKENLWVVGTGGQEEYLKSIAGPTIKFLGGVNDSKLSNIYKNCKALICTATDEDFGITPVEAMSFGKPVIAFRGGGYLETVADGKTGIFFDESTVESLTEKLKNFKTEKFNPVDCRKQADKFSKENFKRKISKLINKQIK